MIDPATIERIKNAADIVEVVGDYVHLTRRGANYMGLCPFHNERTPSFSVNKQRNFCYCFSCKKGGSPVNFIMEKEGLSYAEALRHLARKYGIEIEERELTDEERQRQTERESMFIANEWAMNKMSSDLMENQEGRDVGLSYFTQRGVTDAAIKAFHLGYAVNNGSWLTNAASKAGFDLEVLKKTGLIGTSQDGRNYDRYRGRVIFPIFNVAGKVIAFGGRDLSGKLAKYINSPETPLYTKSNELYGIYQAKSAIMSEQKCFLVEGYMDVIGMWQSGMKNVVASSGTALTDGQIALIHRFTDNITLIYDGDAAGVKAALRGMDMLLSHRLNVKVLLLPDGKDPDEFAREHTPEEFKEYVKEHETDVVRFKAQVMLQDIKSDPQKRIEAINSVVRTIAHIPDPIARDVYVQECSLILGVPDTTIARSVATARTTLLEAMRKERTRKQFPVRETPAENPATEAAPASLESTASAVATATGEVPVQQPPEVTQSSPTQGRLPLTTANYPLLPLEWNIIRYCVRYGFLDCWEWQDESGEMHKLNVVEFLKEELEADGMKFSVPSIEKIFSLLVEMRPAVERFRAITEENIDKEIEEKRRQAIERIASGDFSVSEIQKEEKKLEEDLAIYRAEVINEAIRDYPGHELASHEDDEIRTLASKMLYEKHQLSNIYLKNPTSSETEEDRLQVLVPRALSEWRNEILNQKIKDIFREFHRISGQGLSEEEQRLQAELANLMAQRTELAKDIGERILLNK